MEESKHRTLPNAEKIKLSQTGHGQQRPTTEFQCGSDQSEDWGRGQLEQSVLPENPSGRSQRVRITWSGWLLKHKDV